MKRYLVLLSFLLVGWAGTAWAQQAPTYQVTTTPTFVINDGRAEVMGSIRFTVTSPTITANTFGTTIQATFQNVACDDTLATFPAAATLAPGPQVGPQLITNNATAPEIGGTANLTAITNTSAGCVVSITIAPASTAATNDFIELQGVRGRIDLSPGVVPGTSLSASLSATPSTSALFTVPNSGVVGISSRPLDFVDAVPGSNLVCIGPVSLPSITFKEDFNGAFVQYVDAADGFVVPADHRPFFGAVNNSQVHLKISNLPTGITLTWPLRSGRTLLADGVHLSEMSLVSQSTTGDSAVYEFSTELQNQSDITLESYTIGFAGVCDVALVAGVCPIPIDVNTKGTVTVPATAAFGTGTIQIQMYPPLSVTPADATTILSNPFVLPYGPPAAPRFNDPYQPSPGTPFITNGPCTTTLLYPWVALVPSLSYDTGIVIANTSADPSNLPAGNVNWMGVTNPTLQQSGTCTLYGYNTANPNAPAAPASDMQYTTPTIPAGGSWGSPVSTISPFNAGNFTGYVIAICNFQYGHGFAYITQNYGTDSYVAQGYVALLIPDPVTDNSAVLPARLPNNGMNGSSNFSGEGLSQ